MAIDLLDPETLHRAGDPRTPPATLLGILGAWEADPDADPRIAAALAGNPALSAEALARLMRGYPCACLSNAAGPLAVLADPRMGIRLVEAVSGKAQPSPAIANDPAFEAFVVWMRESADVPAWFRRALVDAAPFSRHERATARHARLFVAACENSQADPAQLAAAGPDDAWRIRQLIFAASMPVRDGGLGLQSERHPWWKLPVADPESFICAWFDPGSPWSEVWDIEAFFWPAFLSSRWGKTFRPPAAWTPSQRQQALLQATRWRTALRSHFDPDDLAAIAPVLQAGAAFGDDGFVETCARLAIPLLPAPDGSDPGPLCLACADTWFGIGFSWERIRGLVEAWAHFPEAQEALKEFTWRRTSDPDPPYPAFDALLRSWEGVDEGFGRALRVRARKMSVLFRIWDRLQELFPAGPGEAPRAALDLWDDPAVEVVFPEGRRRWRINEYLLDRLAVSLEAASSGLASEAFDGVLLGIAY